MATTSKTFTKTLDTASLNITEASGLTQLSIFCVSGVVTVLGNLRLGDGTAPDAITIPVGTGINLGNSSSNILDTIVINAAAGVANLAGS